MLAMQNNELFDRVESVARPTVLEGFHYQSSIIEPGYEAALLVYLRELPFREFEFHGFHGKRRVISFGWRYDYSGPGSLEKAGEIPSFLLDLRTLVADFVQVDAAKTKIGQSKKDDPVDVAKAGYEAMMSGEGDVVTGFKNKVMSAAALFTPSETLAEQHRKKTEPGSANR
jgi:hypothetical protein